MRLRTLEKLLYKAGILLVVVGAFVKFMLMPDVPLGLYLILAGHILGVVGIFMYMKQVNDLEQKEQATDETARHLKNN